MAPAGENDPDHRTPGFFCIIRNDGIADSMLMGTTELRKHIQKDTLGTTPAYTQIKLNNKKLNK